MYFINETKPNIEDETANYLRKGTKLTCLIYVLKGLSLDIFGTF